MSTGSTAAASGEGERRRERLRAARLYLVCDSTPGGRDLRELLRTAIAGGVDVVQLRDKRLGDEELVEAARAAKAVCESLGALLIVNDRPAVALAVGADGVHVGQDDMPVARVRELVGSELLVGLSTHAPAEIDAAIAATGSSERPGSEPSNGAGSEPPAGGPTGAATQPVVDYIGVGPVHATPTKPGRPAVGLELVRYAAAHAPVPFFAIGGIELGNVDEVLAAGARGIAVVRAIADAADPGQAAQALRGRLAARPLEEPLVRI